MKQVVAGIRPQVYARTGGAAYLIIIVLGLIGEMFIRGRMIEAGDAHATAANLAAAPLAWRLGIAGDLVMHICDVVVVLVLFVLLRPVHRNLAIMALLFNLVQTGVLVANKMNLLVPIFLSENASYLKAFNAQQLQALSYVSIKAHDYGFGVGLIYFGCACLIWGYLIIKSQFLPAILGVFMGIAGFSYLVNSFALIIDPPLAQSMFPLVLVPAFIGEASLCLWLLIKGVRVEKWAALVLQKRKDKEMGIAGP